MHHFHKPLYNFSGKEVRWVPELPIPVTKRNERHVEAKRTIVGPLTECRCMWNN